MVQLQIVISGIVISGIGVVLYLYKKKLDKTTIFSFSLDDKTKKVNKIEIYKNSKNENDDNYLLQSIKENMKDLHFNNDFLFVKNIIKTYVYETNWYMYNTYKGRIENIPVTNIILKNIKTSYNEKLKYLIDYEINVCGDTTYKNEHFTNRDILHVKQEIKTISNEKYLISFNTHKKRFTCVGYNRNILKFYLMI